MRDRRHSVSQAASPSSGDLAAGFTLLEVVIALSLSLLLLTAVYGAIRLQYRLTNSGREQMERAQLSRAILRQIENDIRSVVWQLQEPAQSSEDEESTSAVDDAAAMADSSTGSTSEPVVIESTDDAFTSGSSGIFGDSQNLVLHISRPSRSLVYGVSPGDDTVTDRSDLASVSYFIADGSAGGLSAAVASQHGGGSSVLGGVVGLARMEGDRLSIELAGENEAVDSLASAAQLLAPEVVSIEFAYWDGLEWLDSWDSVSSGALPSAIGITIGLDTETAVEDRTMAGQLQQALTTGEAAETSQPALIRYVVAVPLAEPYVSEASF